MARNARYPIVQWTVERQAPAQRINSIIVLKPAVAKSNIIKLIFRIPRLWLYKDSVNSLHFVPRAAGLRRSLLPFPILCSAVNLTRFSWILVFNIEST